MFHRLGRLVSEMGRREEVLYAYRAAVHGNEDMAEGFNTLGNMLVAKGLNEESLGAYAKALQIKPQEAMYHYNRGIPLKALGRWEETEAAYNKALEFRPDYAEAMNNLGILLLERGRAEESAEVLRRERRRSIRSSRGRFIIWGIHCASWGGRRRLWWRCGGRWSCSRNIRGHITRRGLRCS